jgi:glycerol-3-phosphate acyltransferase PlsY
VTDLIAVLLGYLTGSVPFAYLLARRRGVDLRLAGSGNVGASNVLRTSGVLNAVAALCLDGAKGSLAVLLAERLSTGAVAPVAAGVASVLGHVYPIWLGFRGGKGVATAAGVFAVLAPFALAVGLVVFTVTVWMTRFISVGSMAAAVSLPAAMAIEGEPVVVVAGGLASAVVILHRHRANLGRLVEGTERRIGQRIQP